VKPTINQIEYHPYLTQENMIKLCKEKDIQIMGYSPFGCPDRPAKRPDDPDIREDPKVKEIAKKYKKTVYQVLIRFQLDNGIMSIPKSAHPKRVVQNYNIWDFKLSNEDLEELRKLNRSLRYLDLHMFPVDDTKYWPFLTER
jgi:aldehyde reductase